MLMKGVVTGLWLEIPMWLPFLGAIDLVRRTLFVRCWFEVWDHWEPILGLCKGSSFDTVEKDLR
jgi:hypothetical protein